MDGLLEALKTEGLEGSEDFKRLVAVGRCLSCLYGENVSKLIDNFLLFKLEESKENGMSVPMSCALDSFFGKIKYGAGARLSDLRVKEVVHAGALFRVDEFPSDERLKGQPLYFGEFLRRADRGDISLERVPEIYCEKSGLGYLAPVVSEGFSNFLQKQVKVH